MENENINNGCAPSWMPQASSQKSSDLRSICPALIYWLSLRPVPYIEHAQERLKAIEWLSLTYNDDWPDSYIPGLFDELSKIVIYPFLDGAGEKRMDSFVLMLGEDPSILKERQTALFENIEAKITDSFDRFMSKDNFISEGNRRGYLKLSKFPSINFFRRWYISD